MGKTTVADRTAEILQAAGVPLAGFVTREIREGRRRVGFTVETFHGASGILAHVDYRGEPRVGKYGVDLPTFERVALRALAASAPDDVVVVDELGKMELASEAFRRAFTGVFESARAILATVHVFRHPFTDELKRRPGCRVIRVQEGNRDALPELLARELRGSGSGSPPAAEDESPPRNAATARARWPHLLLAVALFVACHGGGPEPLGDASGPRLDSVSPSQTASGQPVTLSGVGFGRDPGAVSVTFDDLPGAVLSVSDLEVVAVVPRQLTPGQVVVRVAVRGVPATPAVLLTILGAGLEFESVSAGSGFTCGIVRGAGAYCWGSGLRGQLGSGLVRSHAPAPQPVANGGSLVTVAAGNRHACGLDAAGQARCWGLNNGGQLGNGALTDSPQPVAVTGSHAFRSVTPGIFHTCGLTLEGKAYCWGDNEFGQLGTGTTGASAVPVAVAGDLTLASLGTGGFHACGVTASGEAYCWGKNRHGEVGDGTHADASRPVRVSGAVVWTAMSSGRGLPSAGESTGEHTCGLSQGGYAWCWGFNAHGQLGDGSRNDSPVPLASAGSLTFSGLSTGGFHTCGVTTTGEAVCWGANDSGQLGVNTAGGSVGVPLTVLARLRFLSVSAGAVWKSTLLAVRSHTCGVAEDGSAFCWGRNDSGQLGSGGVSTESTPVPVTTPQPVEPDTPPGEPAPWHRRGARPGA